MAKVEHDYKKTGSMVAAFGLTVLAVNCIRESGANVIEVMQGLYKANEELNRGVLRERGLMLEQVYDETEYIHSAVGLVMHRRNLKRLNLLASGAPVFKKGDRLVEVQNGKREVHTSFVKVPVYCTHVQPLRASLGRSQNLWLVLFGDRAKGANA